MKVRLAVAAGLVAATALSLTAHAATPTLDGKKVKVISVKATGSGQHDSDQVTDLAGDPTGSGPDRTQCAPSRCSRTVFTYSPAKGVKGDLLFTVAWPNTASDLDLFVGMVNKDGSSTTIASCGASAGSTEKVFIPASELKAGKKYVMVIDFYRAASVTATGKIEIGASNTVKSTVPKDPVFEPSLGSSVNCGL
jgi:hypothetical protein